MKYLLRSQSASMKQSWYRQLADTFSDRHVLHCLSHTGFLNRVNNNKYWLDSLRSAFHVLVVTN